MEEMTRVQKIQLITVVVMFIAMFCVCSWYECHYTRKDCTVCAVQGTEVQAIDSTGNVWAWYNTEDTVHVGDTVDLLMYTAHTDSYIYDDEVVSVRVHR